MVVYCWCYDVWCGCLWYEMVLYELYVGVCGGYVVVEWWLLVIVELGVIVVELMLVNVFFGVCNWGYDGVLLFVFDVLYGWFEELKLLVDIVYGFGL